MERQGSSVFDQLDALLAQGKITDEEYHDLWNAVKGRREEASVQPERKRRFFLGISDDQGLRIAAVIWTLSLIISFGAVVAGETWLCVLGAGVSWGMFVGAFISKGGTPRQRRLLKWSALATTVILAGIIGIGMRIDASRRNAARAARQAEEAERLLGR